ncbi:RidA family protein [Duganella violaceipulchra]|uniref:Enamine deaminase RidA (YjgF/YER057c/UK114 family) n=1 Tax=Duganella violaceipulchra TaxID=2849652 RepID=A0AA41H9H4_9BURK|nr:RidA family protein [Duganella violaceicalia]MBV6322040.1 RidA family protein [Duganella violaceicalia]MCP2006962.1 enamine deaminase RidA (YjgF/YER057c/UK114 family) [Duganella violaceicalia]
MNTQHHTGVAERIGRYADGVEASAGSRWLYSAGTPGMRADGTLPGDIAGQTELAWSNIMAVLDKAGMTAADIVKMTHYLVNAADLPACVAVRNRVLGELRPASMLMVVAALPRPDFLVEVEIVAARPLVTCPAPA